MTLTKDDTQTFLELIETTELANALDEGPYWAEVEYQNGGAHLERPTLRLLQERIDAFFPRGILSVTIHNGPLPKELW